jgi:hypothetical protein
MPRSNRQPLQSQTPPLGATDGTPRATPPYNQGFGATPPYSQGYSQGLALPRRDALGFLEDIPSLTSSQVSWLTYRMGTATDAEASQESGIPEAVAASWRDDPAFMQVASLVQSNTREAFRLLGAQLLVEALKTLQVLYRRAQTEGNIGAARTALTLHLRSQGLLIDRVATDDANKIDALMVLLRTPQPIQVLDMTPRR